MKRLLVDAHQDLAWNILTFGRDYARPVDETRQREHGSYITDINGDTLLSWDEYQRGKVALVFATIFAEPARTKAGEWDTQCYADYEQAHRIYSRQLDVYSRMVDSHPDKFQLVHTTHHLDDILSVWNTPDGEATGHRVGLIPLMEGGDGIRHIEELEMWWQRGVRVIGPAWMGTKFSGGTREPGPLTRDGHALLEAMADFGFTLDLSHMDWEAALQALDEYEGNLMASHANALKQVKNGDSNRFLTDEIIERIIERNGVIGVVPFNRFLIQGWKNSDSRELCPLDMVAAQIDYICQLAGNARHVGFGTDFDGGFGLQQVPPEINTIADLHKLAPLLANRGYNEADVDAIFGGNWIEYLRRTLPQT